MARQEHLVFRSAQCAPHRMPFSAFFAYGAGREVVDEPPDIKFDNRRFQQRLVYIVDAGAPLAIGDVDNAVDGFVDAPTLYFSRSKTNRAFAHENAVGQNFHYLAIGKLRERFKRFLVCGSNARLLLVAKNFKVFTPYGDSFLDAYIPALIREQAECLWRHKVRMRLP